MKLIDGVGHRRVKLVDEDTDEVVGVGVLQGIYWSIEEGVNTSEASVALDLPGDEGNGDDS